MSSSILPWQHAQWRLIDEMRSIQRLPHALLIKGPPGVGKGRFAERLASLLLCHQPENAPCGSCRSCELSVSGAHPDLRVVVPENESATIGVDQIRALISAFAFTPALGSRKMGVITPAENMTTAAANSLLKTLEEPPGDAMLILIATIAGWLPPTVLSRCQTIDFPAVSTRQSSAWLKTNIAPEHDADLLMTLSRGQPLTAVSWAESDELSVRKSLFDDMAALLIPDPDPVATASRWKSLGVARSARWLGSLLMDLIKLSVTGSFSHLANQDLAESMQPLIRRLDLKRLFSLLDACQETVRVARGYSGLNEQLLLESFAIAITGAVRKPG